MPTPPPPTEMDGKFGSIGVPPNNLTNQKSTRPCFVEIFILFYVSLFSSTIRSVPAKF